MTNSKYKLLQAFKDGFDAEIDFRRLFVVLYDKMPFNYINYLTADYKSFIQMLKDDYQIDESSIIYRKEEAKRNKPGSLKKLDYIFVFEFKNELLIEFNDFKVDFYYANVEDRELVLEIASKLKKFKPKKKLKNHFYMVASSRRSEYGIELQQFKISKDAIDISELYNEDFWPVHNQIDTFMKEKKKNGIIMLHGKFGTGKSTYIRYLMQNYNKRFIFLPNYMVESLSSPSFMPFLANYSDSILVLEDCEDLLRPRGNGSRNDALVNLLNLGDGLLSDAMSIQLICTFNADLKNIDPAILRKGRLAARYEFDALEVSKAKALAQKVGIDIEITKPMTIAEVFNADQQNFGKDDNKSVGFGVHKN